MKAALEKLLTKVLTKPQIHSTLYLVTRQMPVGALGFYVNKSDLGLPTGATIVGLIVEQTPANGYVTGNAFDINDTQIYVGLYNHYTTALNAPTSIRVLYEI